MKVRKKKASEKKVDHYFVNLKDEGFKPPKTVQGSINKSSIQKVMAQVNLDNDVIIDVIFALCDDTLPNLFNPSIPFCAGARVAHLACYVGIYTRHRTKLDREGRDYWLAPLRDIGVLETITYDKDKGFIPGHLKAKSPNSAYRLSPKFLKILRNPSVATVKKFFSTGEIGKRRLYEKKAVDQSVKVHGRGDHYKLIQMAKDLYVEKFLPDFTVIFTDDADGKRITKEEQNQLKEIGVELTLDDAWPDIILLDNDNGLWFIEAVTSDGEVDAKKLQGLIKLCKRNKKLFRGATTCYLSWKDAGKRQDKYKNIATKTYLWIASDPSVQLLVLN